MIVSKYGKSYDTADGSEQQDAAPREPAGAGAGASRPAEPSAAQSVKVPAALPAVAGAVAGEAGQRWEDDGGPFRVLPPVSPLEFSMKPTWSVVSLRDLNEAVRLGDWPDNPDHLRRAARDAEREKRAAIELAAERAASRAHAKRNRDRNLWENT